MSIFRLYRRGFIALRCSSDTSPGLSVVIRHRPIDLRGTYLWIISAKKVMLNVGSVVVVMPSLVDVVVYNFGGVVSGYGGWSTRGEKPAVSHRAGPRSSRHEGSRGEARMDNILPYYCLQLYGLLYIANMYNWNERAVSAEKPLSGPTTGRTCSFDTLGIQRANGLP